MDFYKLINNTTYILILLFLVSYVALERIDLPIFFKKLINNSIFRLIIILYILYEANNDLKLSVFITLCFLLMMHISNNNKVKEMFDSMKNIKKLY
jgi:hypothetical protein